MCSNLSFKISILSGGNPVTFKRLEWPKSTNSWSIALTKFRHATFRHGPITRELPRKALINYLVELEHIEESTRGDTS
jgi:hypothetical protein